MLTLVQQLQLGHIHLSSYIFFILVLYPERLRSAIETSPSDATELRLQGAGGGNHCDVRIHRGLLAGHGHHETPPMSSTCFTQRLRRSGDSRSVPRCPSEQHELGRFSAPPPFDVSSIFRIRRGLSDHNLVQIVTMFWPSFYT